MFSPCRDKGRIKGRAGFVLVSVLVLGAMLVTCATAFTWFARMHVKSASREKISMTNRSMAQTLTMAIMSGLKANTSANYDSPLLDWFKPFTFSDERAGTFTVQTLPLDDKIPLRNLFLPDGSTLRNEFRYTWDEIWNKLGRRELANVALDFLDKDTRPKMGGAERPAHINRPILDMSEFLILEEMTPELLYGTPEARGLADFCTLWSGGTINLNVAPVHVLEALSGMDAALADRIADYRQAVPLTGMGDLSKIPGFPAKARASLMNVAGFTSRYFLIKIDAQEQSGPGGTGFSVIFDKTDGTVTRWEEI